MENLYNKCLSELKARPNWTAAYVPILEQYVFMLEQAGKLKEELEAESVEVEHTNKASHTNKATSPKWRMFLELSKSAAGLAKDLQLNPATNPAKEGGRVKSLEAKMKAA